MEIKKLMEDMKSTLNEFYIEPEDMREHITERIDELSEVALELTDVNEETIPELIKVYKRIESLATDIMRYAETTWVELEDRIQ